MKQILFIALLLLAACSDGKNNATDETDKPNPAPEETTLTDDELLDLIEHKTFDYFWDAYNDDKGLSLEVLNEQGVPKDWRATYAGSSGVGWGLSAMCIADARGWKPKEEIRRRVVKTLNAIYDDPDDPDDFHIGGDFGVAYQMFDVHTGAQFSKYWCASTTGAGLMTCAILQTMEHFKNDAEIHSLCDKIYRSIQWDKFVNDGTKGTTKGAVSAGWYPAEPGIPAGLRGEYTMFNEYVLFYILGMGSPTYPLTEESWDAWNTGLGTKPVYYKGIGPIYYPGWGWHSCEPTAYVYQMPANYIDWRGMKDKYGIDYWEAGVTGLTANRQICLDIADKRRGDDPQLWGWTACENKVKPGDPNDPDNNPKQTGYQGYSVPYVATVAPSAVVASIAHIPELAMPSIRYLYEKYGRSIFGRYGFVDSFSLRDRWVCPNYLALDQGNTLCMIENYRTGMVWKEVMASPYIQEGLRKAGFRKYK